MYLYCIAWISGDFGSIKCAPSQQPLIFEFIGLMSLPANNDHVLPAYLTSSTKCKDILFSLLKNWQKYNFICSYIINGVINFGWHVDMNTSMGSNYRCIHNNWKVVSHWWTPAAFSRSFLIASRALPMASCVFLSAVWHAPIFFACIVRIYYSCGCRIYAAFLIFQWRTRAPDSTHAY